MAGNPLHYQPRNSTSFFAAAFAIFTPHLASVDTFPTGTIESV